MLGALLSLDSVRTDRVPGEPTHVRLLLRVHVDGLAAAYPRYAAALHTVIGPTRIRCVVTDGYGSEWLRLELADGRIATEFAATRDGHFAPLAGPARPLPDSLTLYADVSTRVWVVSIGARHVVSQMLNLRRPHVGGWRFSFRDEPTWDFPLALDHLVKSSLARPFADSGSVYEAVIVDSAGPSTLFERRGLLTVEESLIMRWLGGLATALTGAFSDTATRQEDAFFASVLGAARTDLRAMSVPAERPYARARPGGLRYGSS